MSLLATFMINISAFTSLKIIISVLDHIFEWFIKTLLPNSNFFLSQTALKNYYSDGSQRKNIILKYLKCHIESFSSYINL